MAIAQIKDYPKFNSSSAVEKFLIDIKSCTSSREVNNLLTKTLFDLLHPDFISFVENQDDGIKVVSQIGDKKHVAKIKKLFNRSMSEQIFNWVLERDSMTSISFAGMETFYFIPISHRLNNQHYKHGIIVLMLNNNSLALNKNVEMLVQLIIRTCSQSVVNIGIQKENMALKNKLSFDGAEILRQVNKAFMPVVSSSNLSVEVICDDDLSGDFIWIGENSKNEKLVFMGEIETNLKPSPVSLIKGYIISFLNSFQQNNVQPNELLSRLNMELNKLFVDTAITVNAFYGIVDELSRELKFSCAKYSVPILIGSEQQIISLDDLDFHSESLGVSKSTVYIENRVFLPLGSRVVLLSKDTVNLTSKVGTSYDETWLYQILETISSLSLVDMRDSLDNLLTQNNSGTAKICPRLGLLLELT